MALIIVLIKIWWFVFLHGCNDHPMTWRSIILCSVCTGNISTPHGNTLLWCWEGRSDGWMEIIETDPELLMSMSWCNKSFYTFNSGYLLRKDLDIAPSLQLLRWGVGGRVADYRAPLSNEGRKWYLFYSSGTCDFMHGWYSLVMTQNILYSYSYTLNISSMQVLPFHCTLYNNN